jgi:hypothetical protein
MLKIFESRQKKWILAAKNIDIYWTVNQDTCQPASLTTYQLRANDALACGGSRIVLVEFEAEAVIALLMVQASLDILHFVTPRQDRCVHHLWKKNNTPSVHSGALVFLSIACP